MKIRAFHAGRVLNSDRKLKMMQSNCRPEQINVQNVCAVALIIIIIDPSE